MEERLSGAGGDLAAHVHSGVATVTLNRPQALNALTFGMLESLRDWLDHWEKDPGVRMVVLRGAGPKAFCAGGDIRALYAQLASGSTEHHRFFEVEYALDYRIHTYPKTIVAVMDGIVMSMPAAAMSRWRMASSDRSSGTSLPSPSGVSRYSSPSAFRGGRSRYPYGAPSLRTRSMNPRGSEWLWISTTGTPAMVSPCPAVTPEHAAPSQ